MTPPSDNDPLAGLKLSAADLKRLSVATPIPLKQPLMLRWTPQADITTHELAQLVPYHCGKPLFEEVWDKLGTMQRHFERVEPSTP